MTSTAKNNLNNLAFTKAASIAEFGLVAGLFFLHILVNEKNENTFIEYDIHFFIIVSCILFAAKGVQNYFQKKYISLSLNRVSQYVLAFSLYITIQSLFIGGRNFVILECIFLLTILYFQFLKFWNRSEFLNFLIVLFLIAVLLTQLTFLFNISLFSGRSYTNPKIIVSGPSACYLAAVFPFVFSLIFSIKDNNKSKKIYFISASILTLINLYLLVICRSRTAWVACAISSLFILNYHFQVIDLVKQLIRNKLFKITFFSIIFLIVYVSAWQLYNYNPASANSRLLIYKISVKIMSISPIFGIGIGEFEHLYNLFQADYFLKNSATYETKMLAADTFFAFNEFLHVGIEFGIVGLVILVAIFIQGFRTLKHADKRGERGKSNFLVCGSAAALISIFICSFSSYPFSMLSISVLTVFYLSIIVSQTKPSEIRLPFAYPVYIIVAIIMLFIIRKELERIKALKRWEKAANLAVTGRFVEARPFYEQSYPILSSNGRFVFNYGAELFIDGYKNESIIILERSKKIISHSDLYLYLGRNFDELGNFQKAKENYTIASNIAPSKFLPMELLLNLYIKYGKFEDAKRQAKKIIEYPVKIDSEKLRIIKINAQQFLNKN